MQSNNSSLRSTARQTNFIKLIGDAAAPTLHINGIFGWQLASQERPLLDGMPPRLAAIDLTQVHELDTVGALIILRLCHEIKPQPKLIGLSASQQRFLEDISHETQTPEPVVVTSLWQDRIRAAGDWAYDLVEEITALTGFLGEILRVAARTLRQPKRLWLLSIVHHVREIGFKSLPIVGLVSLLLGIGLVCQGIDQLRRFGASQYVATLLGLSVLREFGLVVTALIIASRFGSAFAAQIGTMQANEEIDAMRTIGMDPIDFLVLPRVIALMITLPLLVFVADCMAIIGGAVTLNLALGISLPQFFAQFHATIQASQFWIGEAKAPLFGLVIALVGCFQGLRFNGHAEGIGRQTTTAVAQSISLVIVADAIFSILFSLLQI